jgi:ADP-ribose pyrophosphatase YjhB (NUDIX family)
MSPFVRSLREALGTRLLLLPSVTVLPRDQDGNVLLVRNADDGRWATIGGTVEPDEPPEVAACREAKEEAGIDVELRDLVGVFGGPGYRVEYPNGDVTSYVVTVYDAVILSGTPTPDHEETTDVAWFAPDRLASLDLGELNQRLFAAIFTQ